MKIREEQLHFLNQFSCERLTDSLENESLIKSFSNNRNPNLVRILQNDAWNKDQTGKIAYYIIKGPDEEPWLYFSLKCGALFQPFEKETFEKKKNILNDDLNEDSGTVIVSFMRTAKKRKLNTIKELLDDYEKDILKEGTRPILRVGQTFPGIEMVEFCANDKKKILWKEFRKQYKIRYTMGQVFFWKFIVDKFEEIQKIVGCQYAFLYAADSTEDDTLVNYYNVSLKFTRQTEMFGVTKPIYDWRSVFMYQEIRQLFHFQESFWNSFNVDQEDDII